MCLFMSFFVPYCCNMQCGCYAFGDVSGLSERLTAELTFGCGDSIPGSGALMAPLALLQLLGHEAERRYNSVSRQADPMSLRTCPPCLLPPRALFFVFELFAIIIIFTSRHNLEPRDLFSPLRVFPLRLLRSCFPSHTRCRLVSVYRRSFHYMRPSLPTNIAIVVASHPLPFFSPLFFIFSHSPTPNLKNPRPNSYHCVVLFVFSKGFSSPRVRRKEGPHMPVLYRMRKGFVTSVQTSLKKTVPRSKLLD